MLLILTFFYLGLRTLCLAFCDIKEGVNWDDPEEHMTLIGLVGIRDNLHLEVPNAVAMLQHAGIIVRMITGESKNLFFSYNLTHSI